MSTLSGLCWKFFVVAVSYSSDICERNHMSSVRRRNIIRQPYVCCLMSPEVSECVVGATRGV